MLRECDSSASADRAPDAPNRGRPLCGCRNVPACSSTALPFSGCPGPRAGSPGPGRRAPPVPGVHCAAIGI